MLPSLGLCCFASRTTTDFFRKLATDFAVGGVTKLVVVAKSFAHNMHGKHACTWVRVRCLIFTRRSLSRRTVRLSVATRPRSSDGIGWPVPYSIGQSHTPHHRVTCLRALASNDPWHPCSGIFFCFATFQSLIDPDAAFYPQLNYYLLQATACSNTSKGLRCGTSE